MSQVVSPEEMAALLQGLREAERGSGSLYRDAPKEIMSRGQVFPECGRITSFQKFSNWLMARADLRWPHL
jgi:hypothetical protein